MLLKHRNMIFLCFVLQQDSKQQCKWRKSGSKVTTVESQTLLRKIIKPNNEILLDYS